MSDIIDVVIIGAGELGREIAWVLEDSNLYQPRWNVLGFIEHGISLQGTNVQQLPVLGDDAWAEANLPTNVRGVCAVGDPHLRAAVVKRYKAGGRRFCSVVHPSIRWSHDSTVGEGTVLMPGTSVTTNVRIGSHVVVYVNCSLTHDNVVGDFCNLSPGCQLAGRVTLEDGVDLGTGVCIIPGRRVGAWSVVGAGSVIIRDIPPHVTAAGVPCKVIKGHKIST
jgi:sugar O-acyltransferase (sialic acid O-acetyltransferase NeuD family)